MKSFTLSCLFSITLVLCGLSIAAQEPQTAEVAPPPKGLVVEVTYIKGRPFTYQRVGEWSWYSNYRVPAGWNPRVGEVRVAAIKITPRAEDGAIKARVTVLRGKNHETEDFVADYILSTEKPVVIRELTNLGVEPFELQLVRAPSTVADPPAVVNYTKSLQVTVEPAQSSLPTFLARVQNTSSKPVATFFAHTSIDEVKIMSGAPWSEAGALIAPGDVYQRSFRYPIKQSTVSTGEVPPAQSNLVFNVTAVVFTDGTYEGDDFAAANYLARNAGERAQLRRFIDLVRSKEFRNTDTEIETALSSVNAESVAAEIAQRFPSLTLEQKAELRRVVDFGKSVGVKFFRGARTQPPALLVELMQKRIDALP